MPNKFIFADEAGCFTFNREPNVSRYFILCTIIMDDCSLANDLLALRRQLAWQGIELGDSFHATTDKQAVRDRVFDVLGQHRFSIQATIMEKAKAQLQLRTTKARFYQHGYFYHFKYGATRQLSSQSEALVTTASLGTKKERAVFEEAVSDVMRQTNRARAWKTDFMPAQSDPCLQAVDYCAWAIQRKWERNDQRSYQLINGRITYEFDLFEKGTDRFY